MSKMKLALDVVQDLRNLADSFEALANAASEVPGDPVHALPGNSTVPEAPGGSAPTALNDSPIPATPTEPKLTLVELRAYVAEHSTPENRPKIKAILGKHGVSKLTELPEDQYKALMREVTAL